MASRRGITDDNLWRPTRRAKGHYTKDKLSTRCGAVHSIGGLSRLRCAAYMPQINPRLISVASKLR
jgi:hypothetical protein